MFDGVVYMSSCDKTVPGMLMAAARLDLPAVFEPAGSMKHGTYKGNTLTLSKMREYIGKRVSGAIDDQELGEVELTRLPWRRLLLYAGHCKHDELPDRGLGNVAARLFYRYCRKRRASKDRIFGRGSALWNS